MNAFPRTKIGGVSVSRLVAGTNWFLGYSHQTASKSRWIQNRHNADSIAEVLEVFLRSGVNLVLGPPSPPLTQAIGIAQQRVGEKMHLIGNRP